VRARVAIVDDDEWVRRGRADALREVDAVDAVVSTDHRGALAWTVEWDHVDVLVLDAHDPDAGWDQFPGVQVVERVRALRPRDAIRIVVVTGHAGNDLLRLRFAEAGADYLYDHEALRDVASLAAAIEGEDPSVRLPTTTTTEVNEAIRAIEQLGVEDAFAPGRVQKQVPVSRRQIITLRRRLGRMVEPGPMPTWRRLVEVVNRARGAPPHHDGAP